MKIFAQVLNSILHCKFEQEQPPQFSADIKIIEITNLLPMPSEGWAWDGASFISPAPATLAALKLAKKAEITASFEKTIQQITAGCPPNEIASWSKQEQEARAFTAVALSPTPLIDALANARGVPKAALSARIIAKADLFAGISGQLIGKRQGLEDAVDAATSKTALAAIVW